MLIIQRRPLTLISPAKTHPDVVVQAVAARDRKRAEAFARKHGIPEVKDSYQGEWHAVCYSVAHRIPVLLLRAFDTVLTRSQTSLTIHLLTVSLSHCRTGCTTSGLSAPYELANMCCWRSRLSPMKWRHVSYSDFLSSRNPTGRSYSRRFITGSTPPGLFSSRSSHPATLSMPRPTAVHHMV